MATVKIFISIAHYKEQHTENPQNPVKLSKIFSDEPHLQIA